MSWVGILLEISTYLAVSGRTVSESVVSQRFHVVEVLEICNALPLLPRYEG